jgi:peptidoglycan hydrolase-like protein with peptidoglycan-binding domain
MKQGDKNGKYSRYYGKNVTEIDLLQSHINRILAAKYTQAAGPVDGIFGPLTKQGVQRLQTVLRDDLKLNLGPTGTDGIVGPFTREAINHSCGGM